MHHEAPIDWNILKAFVRGSATPNDAMRILSDPVGSARSIREFIIHVEDTMAKHADKDSPEERRWRRNTMALRDALKNKGLPAVAAAEYAMLLDAIERWWNLSDDESDDLLDAARWGEWKFNKSGRWKAPAALWRDLPPFDFDVSRLNTLHDAIDAWQEQRNDAGDDLDLLEEIDRGLYEAAMAAKECVAA